LREDLDNATNVSNEENIAAQKEVVSGAKSEINTLTKQKYVLQSDIRKLEADVGPVKYIAELVYGTNADNNTLETAVKWVILMLVFVFDPLAIALVLAGIRSVEINNKIEISPIAHVVDTTNIINKPKRKYNKKQKLESNDIIQSETQLEMELSPIVNDKKSTIKTKSSLAPNQVAMSSFSKEWEDNERNK